MGSRVFHGVSLLLGFHYMSKIGYVTELPLQPPNPERGLIQSSDPLATINMAVFSGDQPHPKAI